MLLLGGPYDIWQVVPLLLTEVAVNYYGKSGAEYRLTAVVWGQASSMVFLGVILGSGGNFGHLV